MPYQKHIPAWNNAEICAAQDASGTILRAEVMADLPEGASWLLVQYAGEDAKVIRSGFAASMTTAKNDAWAEMQKVMQPMRLN